jgi:hypothetical protein
MKKKEFFDWHLIGILPIVFAIIYYVFNIKHHVDPWYFLWVCPVAAIITGVFVILRNRFGMSMTIVWIICGPLVAVSFASLKSLQSWQLYHIFSVIVLLVILYKFKETWNPKGFLFGTTTFYAYVMITSYLSGGRINLIGEWFGISKILLLVGILLIVLSVAVLLWNNFEKKNI